MKKQAKQAKNDNKMLTPRQAFEHFIEYLATLDRKQVTELYAQMYQKLSETNEKPPQMRRLVSDAKRDYKETRKNRDGVVLKLGNDRIKMILEAVPGEVYRFVNEPLVRVK